MRRVLALVLTLAVMACGDSTGSSGSAVGTWTLATANASALPVTVGGSGANKTELTAGTLTITSSVYTVSFSVRTTTNGVASTVTNTDNGTVTTSGSSVTLVSTVDSTEIITGGVSGNTLTLTVPGYVYVFTRSG